MKRRTRRLRARTGRVSRSARHVRARERSRIRKRLACGLDCEIRTSVRSAEMPDSSSVDCASGGNTRSRSSGEHASVRLDELGVDPRNVSAGVDKCPVAGAPGTSQRQRASAPVGRVLERHGAACAPARSRSCGNWRSRAGCDMARRSGPDVADLPRSASPSVGTRHAHRGRVARRAAGA